MSTKFCHFQYPKIQPYFTYFSPGEKKNYMDFISREAVRWTQKPTFGSNKKKLLDGNIFVVFFCGEMIQF